MGSIWLTGLADALRRDPYPVVELDGWKTRSRSSGGYDPPGPWCVMWHHTASAGNGANDANYETFVSADAPVCNVNVGRDGTRYVCAAGATNTNGKGGPMTLPDGRTVPADSMNTRAVGIEISNNGVGMTYPRVQIDACFATSLRIAALVGIRPDNVATHWLWTPGRKIDPATAAAVEGPWRPASCTTSGTWLIDDLRAECVRRASSAPTPTPPTPTPDPDPDPDPEDDMPKLIYAFREYANTWSEHGVHLSAEAYAALVAQGATVVVSELTYPKNQHLDSLLAISGLSTDYLVPTPDA